ncbi:MAG: hypothetical protein ACTSVI_17125 [Promethearchaeota archaeon]
MAKCSSGNAVFRTMGSPCFKRTELNKNLVNENIKKLMMLNEIKINEKHSTRFKLVS